MFRFFERLVDPYTPYPEADHPPNKLWPFLREYARPFRRVFFYATVSSVLVAVVEVLLIFYLGRVVDLLNDGGPAAVWDRHGTQLIAIAAFVLLLRPIILALNVAILNNSIIPSFGTLIRWRSHRHVLRQSVAWFENDFAGRIANRIMQTPPAAGEAVFHVFDSIAFSLAYFVGAAVLLFEADLRLAVPLLIWLVLYAFLVRWTVARVAPASKASSEARSNVTGRVVDSYTNIHSVKLFSHHEGEIEYAKEAIEETRRTLMREMRLYSIMDITLVVLNGFLIVSVVGWTIVLWTRGEATVGAVAAATALTLQLSGMTDWFMMSVSNLFRSLGVVSEGMETIAQPIALVDKPGAKPLKLGSGKIEFQALTHHYGRQSGGLDGVDLVISPGEKVGLVGRSGAGKSTLVKLLLRFHEPESGRILIDGQDITKVQQESLRAMVGMVQQESSLLHRSIHDNILYGRPDATAAEVKKAAKRAEADKFIRDLKDPKGQGGYEAQVGERGVKLSGGQRQRITLARVILKDAPILILDEATSALDSEVEAAIQDTLYGMMEGKTVIAIAHRLSTIAKMDRIVVLDEGKIVEIGTHSELLAKEGLYASFWKRQSGGFIGSGVDAQ